MANLEWRQAWNWVGEHGANLALALFALIGAIAVLWAEPSVTAVDGSRCPKPPAVTPRQPSGGATAPTVADAAGDEQRLGIVIGRSGHAALRRSARLAVQGGSTLPADAVLSTDHTDFLRDDGTTLPDSQTQSYARVSRDGRYVTMFVCVDPRAGEVSDFGRYTGSVAIDDERATGGLVPVRVDIEYPNVNRVLGVSGLAALAGLTWAWMMRRVDSGVTADLRNEGLGRQLVVRTAALLVAVPVVMAAAVSDPAWKGTVAQYVTLSVTVGAAVIAAVPTLRALASGVTRNDTSDAPK